ncbi:MAG: hypothetical protein QM743_00585 [Chitinophagaceae bacterium]
MKFLRNNGLSIVFGLIFLCAIAAQARLGFSEYNEDRIRQNAAPVAFADYLHTGHFIEATFENWESEFLQMALFVVFTIFLQQKGSSESKDFDKQEEVDREPDPQRPGAPLPVKKGGLLLKLYSCSLTLSLFLLFIISFTLHFYGSFKDENEQRALKAELPVNASDYIVDPRFWFESFQNWQSEFLSVFILIVFSIYLRQKGSPQSKPVDASNSETGK